jgi:hypothetical protein
MQKLIEALTIFAKYQDREAPTCCEHDVLYIAGITRDEVSLEENSTRSGSCGPTVRGAGSLSSSVVRDVDRSSLLVEQRQDP